MAKLTAPRDTNEIAGGATSLVLPVKGSTTIFQGSIVAINEDGFAIPGKKAAGLKAAGRAEETVENTGADGEATVRITRGVFIFDNSSTASNKLAAADILGPCYIEDDHTVTKSAAGASIAGLVVRVDDEGVAVEMGFGYTGPAAAAAGA